jgi:hypothetical protein
VIGSEVLPINYRLETWSRETKLISAEAAFNQCARFRLVPRHCALTFDMSGGKKAQPF